MRLEGSSTLIFFNLYQGLTNCPACQASTASIEGTFWSPDMSSPIILTFPKYCLEVIVKRGQSRQSRQSSEGETKDFLDQKKSDAHEVSSLKAHQVINEAP